tara:strand:- start:10 stop:501 length:492 start_codon:yes stop_codon:yes gene_type:complete
MDFILKNIDIVTDFALALIIFLVFYFIGQLSRRITLVRILDGNANPFLVNLLGKSIKNICIFIGLLTSLGTLGIDVSALIAGLGLTGFAVGFAMKDMLSNFISGILLMIYTPFTINDNISIDKYKGKVIEINLRYTVIINNGNKILIPNSFVYSKPMEILSSD